MVRVSVVIPVYNVEPWLPACLDSVLAQTLRELEVICIDDASPDRCGEILEEYARRDARVRVVHLDENRRQGYGRNRGMDLAQGKYVYFLDADDMITPDALEKLFDLAEGEALQGIFFDSQVLYESDAMARRYASYPAVRKGRYPDAAETGRALFERFIDQGEWTCYVQRQFWSLSFLRSENIRFPEGVEHEDELLPFEAVLLAERVRYVPELFFIRRYRENSVMTTPPTARNFHGYFMNFCLMEEFLRVRGIQSRAADVNLARIYERVERYYRDLTARGEDVTDWFRPDELDRLYFFAAAQKKDAYYKNIPERLRAELNRFAHVYVYGAGVVARRACRALELAEIAIDGFVVTRHANNPAVLRGRRVFTPEEIPTARKDTLLVLAMTKGYADEVKPVLEASGWHYTSFLDGGGQ